MTNPTPQNSASFTNGIVLPAVGLTTAQAGWDGSVCVISGFNSISNSSAQGYQQSLTLLPFSDGTNIVAAGSAKTLMLEQTIPGGTTPMLGYNLLISQPNNFFPVAVVGELADLLSGKFPAITIPGNSPLDSSTGINAFTLVQNLQAFPSSNLATQFTTALQSVNPASSGSSIDSTMNAYFANTVAYKDLSFGAYLAAQSYLFAFAFAWANFESSYTYFLYTTGQAAGSTTPGGTLSALGTITFLQNAASGTPSLTDPTGGYTITYQPVSGAAIPLTFANGQVLTANGGDEPSICLQGTFMNKSNATGNQSDFGTLIPSLAGTAFGQQTIATAFQQNLGTGGGSGFAAALQGFVNSDGMKLTMDAMNIAMGVKATGEIIGWIYGQAKGWWKGINKPANPSPQQAQEQEAQNLEANQGALEQANPTAQVPAADQIAAGQQELQQEVVETTNAEQQQEIENELNTEADQVENQLELGNNPQVEAEAEELQQQEQAVESLAPSDPDAGQTLGSLQQENQQMQESIDQENTAVEESVGQQEAQQLEQDAQVEDQEIEEQQVEESQVEEQEVAEKTGQNGGTDDEDEGSGSGGSEVEEGLTA